MTPRRMLTIGAGPVMLIVILAVAHLTERVCSTPATGDRDEEWYDFRGSEAYEALDETDRDRLETVTRDFVLLWGALDMYADDHDGRPPERLDDLVPRYLRELPVDPFAAADDEMWPERPGYEQSLDGKGYLYRHGAPGNRAWIIASVGLPEFPYLAAKGNISLGRCKGDWISGINPRRYQPRER